MSVLDLFRKAKPETKSQNTPGFFGTHMSIPLKNAGLTTYQQAMNRTFQRPMDKVKYIDGTGGMVTTMDSDALQVIKAGYSDYFQNIPDAQLAWYGQQGFIGYQICAMLAQNWLINKACTVPAEDATRNGFDLSVDKDQGDKSKQIAEIERLNMKFKLKENLVQFLRMKNVFGVRIAKFVVDSTDPEYYLKPFNIDGVEPGSYRGISQIDPYWVTPELDYLAASDPGTIDFYEPTYWLVRGQRIHKSHLVIARGPEVADILKPTYFYGGIPLTQMIYERVYAAERTANEAPMLALTKRTTAIHIDLTQAEANPVAFLDKINLWAYFRDNYGIKVMGEDETIEQFDTSLADLDAAIMTQYQLVAAAADMPSTKLIGTTPKGFNATGEYESDSYHESLESEQEHHLTPLIDRHHALLIKSYVSPKNYFDVYATWRPLDVPTAKDIADLNKTKAETANIYLNAQVIDGIDERNRLISDPDSGYAHLTEIGDISELTDEETDETVKGENDDTDKDE